MEGDMSKEMHWGGINGKSLCKAIFADIWMVFAVMVIIYLGLGIAGNLRNTPSYTSSAVVAVYPFNQMYTLENSSSALETVGAVNEVLNSEMFRTGLNNRLAEPADYTLYSRQIDRTFILMLSVSSSIPENPYQILRAALDYYGEISPHLVGNSRLEILTEPDFPLSASNSSKILKYRPLLTIFMGFVTCAFLVFMYVTRKTYKTTSAIRRCYQNVRFFRIAGFPSEKHFRRNKGRSGSAANQEITRKTALEVLQLLRTKKDSSVFVTSADRNEGKTEVAVSLAREFASFGKSVLILETDSENTDISEHFSESEILPVHMLSALLQDGTAFESAADAIPDRSINVIIANHQIQDDFAPDMADVSRKILEQAKKLYDVILVDGCSWSASGDDRIWRETADASLAVCRQDQADFQAIDRMMADLRENDPDFLGCVLYGF